MTISDYYYRWGPPVSASHVEHDGITYIELRGHGPGRFVAAVPSGWPLYIFDESGKLVDWNGDPGDSPFESKRDYVAGDKIELSELEKKFAVSSGG